MFEQIKSLIVASLALGMKTSSLGMYNVERDRKGKTVNSAITNAKDLNSDSYFTVRASAGDKVAVDTAREIAKLVCSSRGFDVKETTVDGTVWFNSTNDTVGKLFGL